MWTVALGPAAEIQARVPGRAVKREVPSGNFMVRRSACVGAVTPSDRAATAAPEPASLTLLGLGALGLLGYGWRRRQQAA